MPETKGQDEKPKAISVSRLARRWDMSRETIYQMIRDGRLKAMKKPGPFRILVSTVEAHERAGELAK